MKLRKNEKNVTEQSGYQMNHNPDKLYAKFCLIGMDQATAIEKVKKMFPNWKH